MPTLNEVIINIDEKDKILTEGIFGDIWGFIKKGFSRAIKTLGAAKFERLTDQTEKLGGQYVEKRIKANKKLQDASRRIAEAILARRKQQHAGVTEAIEPAAAPAAAPATAPTTPASGVQAGPPVAMAPGEVPQAYTMKLTKEEYEWIQKSRANDLKIVKEESAEEASESVVEAGAKVVEKAGMGVAKPTFKYLLKRVLVKSVRGLIFGFIDNFVMAILGDTLDISIGVWFGISTMTAGALANAGSDGFGDAIGGTIEDKLESKLKMEPLAPEVEQSKFIKRLDRITSVASIVVGCLIGMVGLIPRKILGADVDREGNPIE